MPSGRGRGAALSVLVLAAAACRSAPPPAASKPAAEAPPKPKATPVAAISPEIMDAVRAANDGPGPKWSAEPPSAVFGVVIERYRLGDGLALVYARDPASGAVCQATWIGSPEHVDRTVLRAIVDLLRSQPGSESMHKLESIGAMVGAGTVQDAAFFRATIPSAKIEERFPVLVDVEAARLRTTIAEDDLAKRAAAIRTTDDAPGGARVRALLERTLDAADKKDAPKLKELLDPRRAAVAVTGDIERGLVLREIRRAFQVEAPGHSMAATPNPSPSGIRASVETDERFDAILVAWPTPPGGEAKEHVALEAIAHVLTGGDKSRLGKALLPKLAAAVEAHAPRTLGMGRLEVFAALRPGVTATKAVSAIDREVRALARGEAKAEEVEAARAAMRASMLADLDRLESRAEWLGRSALAGEPAGSIARRLSAISDLSDAELKASAAKWLSSKARDDVLARPKGGAADAGKKTKRGRKR